MKRAFVFALILAGACAARPAAAQDVWGWSVIIPSVAQTDILGTMLRDQTRQAPQRTTPAAPPRPATPAANPATLTFTPTAQARRANFDRYLAARRGQGDPATVRQLEALLADPTLMPQIERELTKRGLSARSMADAYAIWWIQAWQTSRGDTSDPSTAALRAVQGQAARAILTVPALTTLPDAQKQAFAEGMLVQAVIMGSALEQVQADPGEKRKLADLARLHARQIGLDLDALRLTDAGFVGG